MYYRKKVERKSIEVQMPPTWCSPICKNSMNDVCIEECAIKRDASWFEIKPGLKLQDLPPYPANDTEEMTKDEKFKSVVIYLSKVIEHLMGDDDGEDIYYPASRRILADLTKQNVRLGKERENTSRPNREKRENKRE